MSTNNLPDSLDELFPQLVNMSESEKILKLARHMPCDHCQQDCQGWRPDLAVEDFSLDACICGHDAEHHVDSKQDFVRRLKVALRIDELLEVHQSKLKILTS
jgi:histone acetyltransferase